ncbi:MAG: hypothetical protein Q9226_007692 [Calogaya cf. arnoldii]
MLLQFDPDQSEPESTEAGSDEEMGPVDEEATTVFFGRNIFKIELIGLEYLTLPSPMFRTGFQPTNQLLITKLKRLEVDLSPNRRCDWALRLVCKELADRASLLELRINAHGSAIWGVKVDEEMDEMFEILTIVRGVGSVVFNDPTMSTSTSRKEGFWVHTMRSASTPSASTAEQLRARPTPKIALSTPTPEGQMDNMETTAFYQSTPAPYEIDIRTFRTPNRHTPSSRDQDEQNATHSSTGTSAVHHEEVAFTRPDHVVIVRIIKSRDSPHLMLRTKPTSTSKRKSSSLFLYRGPSTALIASLCNPVHPAKPHVTTQQATMVRTRQSASNVDNSTSAARPSRATIASVPDTEQSVQENALTLIPITHPSDPQKAGARGSYKIPIEMGFRDVLRWGSRRSATEKSDRERGEVSGRLHRQFGERVDIYEEAKDEEGKTVEEKMADGGAGVVDEIHPRIKIEVTEEVHDTDDGLESHITVKEEVAIQPMTKNESTGSISDMGDGPDSPPTVKTKMPDVKNNKRRKMPARDRVTTLRDAIRALDKSDDDSEPDKGNVQRRHILWSNHNTDRELQDYDKDIKRQKRYDSDDSKMELQTKQSLLTDSSASSDDESLTDNEIPNSRGSRTPLLTTPGQSGRKTTSSTREITWLDPLDRMKMLEQRRRKAVQAPKKPKEFRPMSETTKIAHWPESMMSIGPTDHPSRGITSEMAIKMVQERERTNEEACMLEYSAILLARLFSPDTIANLLRGCHRYSILVHDEWSNPAQQTSRFELLNRGEQIPEVVKELVNAYVTADTAVEKSLGVFVGSAIKLYRQAVFARKLQDACNQITQERGEFWRFIQQWTAGPAGVTFTPMTAELTRFVIQTVTGQTIGQLGTTEWGKRRSRFTGIRRQGNGLNALIDVCTPAVCLLVAAMAGPMKQTLQKSDCGAFLEEFVGKTLDLVPEYKTCFKELNERLWQPIMKRHQLPHIRLLNTEVLNQAFTEEKLQSELYKKSVRYWLEIGGKIEWLEKQKWR